jgi:hypothetical protein
MIAKCERLRDAEKDDLSRLYYTLCLVGWRQWIDRHASDAPEAVVDDGEIGRSPHSALKSQYDTK